MAEMMRAAVLHGVEDLRVEEVPAPGLASADDVLVRVHSVGVCGSDIHYYRHGRIGRFVVEQPMILGHECAGEVVEAGANVKHLRLGDRVALEPGVPCRRCDFCRTGRYNLCPDVVFFATPPVDGAFCEYVTSPADFAFRLPDSVSLEEGAMCEPLAVGMYATERAGVGLGQAVAVLGAGPIGLVTLQAAKARGATTLISTDVEDGRLALAKQLGATHTVNARRDDPVGAIKDITGGGGADVVLEAAGTALTIQQSLKAVRSGGRVIIIGLPREDEVPLSMPDLLSRELDVGGLFRYRNVYPAAIAAIASGLVDVKSMITHRYELAQAEDALVFADTHKHECIKVSVSV
jgi:L-iditol 2-dehydrogenase